MISSKRQNSGESSISSRPQQSQKRIKFILNAFKLCFLRPFFPLHDVTLPPHPYVPCCVGEGLIPTCNEEKCSTTVISLKFSEGLGLGFIRTFVTDQAVGQASDMCSDNSQDLFLLARMESWGWSHFKQLDAFRWSREMSFPEHHCVFLGHCAISCDLAGNKYFPYHN